MWLGFHLLIERGGAIGSRGAVEEEKLLSTSSGVELCW